MLFRAAQVTMKSQTSRMKHCLNLEQWLGFLDRTLSSEEEGMAEAHIASCTLCSLVATEFLRLEDVLTRAARQVKSRAALPPVEVSQALDRLHAQVQRPLGITRCLESLRFFLTGMLGTSTAGKAIQSAAKQTGIDEADWPDLIVRLSDSISDLCGDGAAAVVVHIGKLARPI